MTKRERQRKNCLCVSLLVGGVCRHELTFEYVLCFFLFLFFSFTIVAGELRKRLEDEAGNPKGTGLVAETPHKRSKMMGGTSMSPLDITRQMNATTTNSLNDLLHKESEEMLNLIMKTPSK
jgi:hypothetical protein